MQDFQNSIFTTGLILPTRAPSKMSEIHSPGDIDWFRVELLDTVTYSIDLEGASAGAGTLNDPGLALRDALGNFITFNDNSGEGNNARLTFTPDASGTFYLVARSADPNDSGSYRLTVTPEGEAGQVINEVSGVPFSNFSEFGDDFDDIHSQQIEGPGDVDVFEVTLRAGFTYTFDLNAAMDRNSSNNVDSIRENALIDPIVEIRDTDTNLLQFVDDNGNGSNATLSFTPATSDTFFLVARSSSPMVVGTYELSIQSNEVSLGGNGDDFLLTDRAGFGFNGDDFIIGRSFFGFSSREVATLDNLLVGDDGNDTLSGDDVTGRVQFFEDSNFRDEFSPIDFNPFFLRDNIERTDDTFVGKSPEFVFGGEPDNLIGAGGNDIISGGNGDDIIFGGGGFDALSGGVGSDEFVFTYLDEIDHGLDGGRVEEILDFETVDTINFSLLSSPYAFYVVPLTVSVGDELSGQQAEVLVRPVSPTQSELLVDGDGDGQAGGIIRVFHDANIDPENLAAQISTFPTDLIDLTTGSAANDVLTGNSLQNRIFGFNGNDSIFGAGNNDVLLGGLGHDTVGGGIGNDIIFGGPGNDTLFGNNGNDEIYDGFGDDLILGGDGDDRIFLQSGKDQVVGGEGKDHYFIGNNSRIENNTILDFNPDEDNIEIDTIRLNPLVSISERDPETFELRPNPDVLRPVDNGASTLVDFSGFFDVPLGTHTIRLKDVEFASFIENFQGIIEGSSDGSGGDAGGDNGGGGGGGGDSGGGESGSDGGAADRFNDAVPANVNSTVAVQANGVSSNGTIDSIGDQDWFKVALQDNVTYLFNVQGGAAVNGGVGNPGVQLRDAQGTSVAANLGGGSNTSASVTFTPSAAGAFYVAIQSGNFDNNATGNYQLTVTATQPDLVIPTLTASATTIELGQSVTLNATVRNTGDAVAASTTLRYRQSADNSITGDDLQIGTDAVNSLTAGATSAETITITPTEVGTFFLGATVDAVTGEAKSGNNSSSAVQITVTEPEPDPDDSQSILGNAGAESLVGQGGNDTIFAGAGNDTVAGGAGNDEIRGNQDDDLIQGGAGDDNLRGSRGSDSLLGQGGNDVLNGGTDNDSLRGGQGNDNLRGGRQDDSLNGGIGEDTLNGGVGDDELTGGADGDVFVFDQPGGLVPSIIAPGNQISGGSGNDSITDFVSGEDRIQLSSSVNGESITNFTDISARLSADGAGGTVLDLGPGNQVSIQGVLTGSLAAGDFLLV